MKSLGRAQDCCEISRKSPDTCRMAVPSLGKSLGTSRMTEISRKHVDTSRLALEAHRRVWGPAG